MSTDTPLRVGIVGCGGIAQMMHIPTLFERPDHFTIAAIAEPHPQTRALVQAKYNVLHAFEGVQQLVGCDDVDAVILLHSGSHRDSAIAALDAGKHVFIEKPVGYGQDEIAAVGARADKSDRVVMVGYHKRYDPAYLRAREAVRAMRDLRYVEVTVLHPDDGAYREHHAILPHQDSRQTPEDVGNKRLQAHVTTAPYSKTVDGFAGEGSPVAKRVAAQLLYDSLIHDINAVRGILGEPESVVSAHVWRDGFAQQSLTRFPKDVRVNMSWVSVPGLKHYEERLRFAGPDSRVTLTFPSPYLRNMPTKLEIERMDGAGLVEESHTVSYEEAFHRELYAFRTAVFEGQPVPTPWREAQGDATWIDMIVQAMKAD